MKLRYLLLICTPVLAQQTPAQQTAAPAQQSSAAPPQAAASEPVIAGSIEAGYRFIPNVGGNGYVYDSTVDLHEGLRLIGLDLTVTEPSHKYFDHLDVSVANVGDPYDSERLNVQKTGLYRFTLDNSDIAYFNFLPSFANPFIDSGTETTYSYFDTWIRNTDAELDLFPGSRFSPFFGWSRNTWNGSGASSYYAEASEYAVPTAISDHTDTYRGGLQIQGQKYHATLEVGGTEFKDDQGLSNEAANSGDLLTPFMGEVLTLNSLDALYRVRGHSIFTHGSFAANPVSWATLSGQFFYSNPSTNSTYTSTAAGDLFSFDAFSFYNLGQDMATANAEMPRTTGSFTIELRPMKRLRLVEYWSTDRLHNASDLLLIEQLTFAGTLVSDTTSPDADRLNLNQNQQEFDAYFDITSWLTVRGGEKYTWGDAFVRGAAVLETPFESATMSQQAGLGGVSLRVKDRLRVNGDFEGGTANQSFFRTSLHNYEKFHGRAEYRIMDGLKLSGDFLLLRNENPAAGVNLDFLSHAESAALSWTPKKSDAFDVLVDYTHSHINSDIDFLVPQTLTPAYSEYLEDANEGTAFVRLSPWSINGRRPRLSLGGSIFSSTGTRPTNFYQPMARLSVPLMNHLEGNAQWSWYGFNDTLYPFEAFRSNQIMLSLRIFR